MESLKAKRNIKAFDGERYGVWKFRLRALLSELDVIKVLDDAIPEPLTDEWVKAERTAKNVIVEYLSDSFLGFVQSDKSAKEIFCDLDAIYERKSIATQLALRKKLLELKLLGDTPLIQHFKIFEDLITELLAAGAKLEETDKISHLLLTLPKSYDGVITAIETLSEDNLTLAFVKTRLLDHEVKISHENRDTSAKVLNADIRDDSTKNRHFTPRRPHYKRGIKSQYFKNNKKNSDVKCHHCGRKGHVKKNCYHYKRTLNYQNFNRNRTVQNVELSQPMTSNDNTTGFAFMAGDFKSQDDNKITFLLDSGASDHLVNRDDLFDDFVQLQTPVKISVAKTGAYITATKRGTIQITSNLGIQGILENVFYCPDVPYNLLSVRRMQQSGLTIIFDHKGVTINKGGKTIIGGKFLNNLIGVEFVVNNNNVVNSIVQVNSSLKLHNYQLWHERLGHIGKSKFLELKNKQMVEDMNQISQVVPNDNSLCEACINGKQTRLPFNKSKDKNHVKRPLFIVHTDVCGPITPTTVTNKNYFVLFVDQYTHYCVTYLITNKSDVFSVFRDYIAKGEAHFNSRLVNLYCDNGGEYLSTEMKDFCIQKGISYHLTVPRTPQLNGVSERMIRTITEKARAMIFGAKLNKSFWGEAVLTATYLINLTPTKALNQLKTPYELWHGKKPQIKYLKVFGSTVYVHNKTRKTKFEEKSLKGILVGYEPNGYKVWDVETEKFSVVRDVIVDETNFLVSRPLAKPEGVNLENSSTSSKTGLSDLIKISSKSVSKSDNTKSDTVDSRLEEKRQKICELGNEINKFDTKTNKYINEKSVIKTDKSAEPASNNSLCPLSLSPKPELRRSDRIKNHPPVTYKEDDLLNDYLMCAQSIVCKIPTCYQDLKNTDDRSKWEQAIQEEINSLLINNTWSLVTKPDNKNIVDCKWVFTLKNDEFGNPSKYKARLVARGFSQEYLKDYDETFAPVARISSLRFIIAFSNQYNLLLHHMDVKTAFLNGELKEEIFMKIPEGVKSNPNKVCKLNKALYGLKQSARCWFQVFEKALKEKGFKNSSVDRCIYILDGKNISENIYVVLYVDDIVIATAKNETMQSFKNYLANKFHMVDLKEIKLFLGIKIERTDNMITMSQSAYIKTILNKFNMHDCKPVSTPLPSKLNYTALNSEEKYDSPCRNLIGCLMYVMLCSRPDLSTAVNILSRYQNKNNKELWQCLKRILRYLKGTINFKLTYSRGDFTNILSGYVDSNWGGDDDTDRKSTTGYLFKLFDRCVICWNTKRQASVAVSSTEAEYMALFEAVKEALWLKSLATSINIIISEPIIIYEDNNGCISIANNPTNHKRSKHINIKYHFSREQIEKGEVKLMYLSTDNQIADVLTKPLPKAKFEEFRVGLGLVDFSN